MTISTPDTGTPDRSHTATVPGLAWWQAIAAGAAAATAVNLLIFGVARLADASLVVRQAGGADHEVTAAGVIFSSIVPLTGGLVVATLLALLWPGFLRLAQIVGGGFALITVAGPILSDTDGATRTALALMHVVVGVAVVAALEMIRRRRTASGSLR